MTIPVIFVVLGLVCTGVISTANTIEATQKLYKDAQQAEVWYKTHKQKKYANR